MVLGGRRMNLQGSESCPGGGRYNTVNWIRQGEEGNILEVGPRSRKVRTPYFLRSRFSFPVAGK